MNTSSTIRKVYMGEGKINKLYSQENPEKSLVVIFPDENYNCDKPLLYYMRKVALVEGHDVLCLSYKRKLTWRDMGLYTIDLEADSIIDIVRKCMRSAYKNIYFVSKGIGTEVAGVVSDRLGYEKVRSIYLTPTNYAIKHIVNSKGLVVVGTNDGIFTQDCINKIQECKNIEIISIKDSNRYLEVPDNINRTMEALGQITDIYVRFFKESA